MQHAWKTYVMSAKFRCERQKVRDHSEGLYDNIRTNHKAEVCRVSTKVDWIKAGALSNTVISFEFL
jgi:hypothetical protein